MKPQLTAALLGLVGVAAPVAAHAAGPWLAPSEINFSADNPSVTIDASSSDDLLVLHRAIAPEQIKAVGPDGAALTPENVSRGRSRTTFDLRVGQPGTTRVFTVSEGLNGTYTLDGKIYRLDTNRRPGGPGGPQGQRPEGQRPEGQRPEGAPPPPADGPAPGTPGGRPLPGVTDVAQIPATATDIKLVQSISRSETFITHGAPSDWKPTGVGLELIPGAVAPTDVALGDPATFKLTMDGKPAAGAEIEVAAANQRYQVNPASLKLKADASGAFTVKWPSTGYYWITAKAEGPGTIPNAVRRAQYTAVVVVQRP